MAKAFVESFDPFLEPAEADAMVRLFETFPGGYGMYVQESPKEGIGQGFLQRHDAAMYFFETGGRSGKAVSLETFAARANTLRETYAYDRPVVPGIEPLLANEKFTEAARKLYGKPIVVPNIVYANVVLPGQELSVHTDVPEFRGANRKHEPEWLLVVMHLSGLFEPWRMPIATGVSWYGRCPGGGFYFYPDGIEGPEIQLEPKHNTAVLLDTDSVFHGVDLVGEPDVELPELQPGIRLRHDGGSAWHVERDDRELARYDWDDIRLSISWKAYCYADDAERRRAEEHTEDLDHATILATLVDDLRRRGRIRGEVPPDRELGEMLMREYIRFPLQPHARRRRPESRPADLARPS